MVVYLLGKTLWGLPGAVIATVLLLVVPIDFAWSTMLANDFFMGTLAWPVLLVSAAGAVGLVYAAAANIARRDF